MGPDGRKGSLLNSVILTAVEEPSENPPEEGPP